VAFAPIVNDWLVRAMKLWVIPNFLGACKAAFARNVNDWLVGQSDEIVFARKKNHWLALVVSPLPRSCTRSAREKSGMIHK